MPVDRRIGGGGMLGLPILTVCETPMIQLPGIR